MTARSLGELEWFLASPKKLMKPGNSTRVSIVVTINVYNFREKKEVDSYEKLIQRRTGENPLGPNQHPKLLDIQ